MIAKFLALLVALVLSSAALAFEPDEVLSDPVQEARARDITRELRCLVCQNESIDASNAPLAKDLRVLVRERIKAGDTDSQVLDYVVARYGRFVLLRPPVEPQTYIVWFGPFALLIVAGASVFLYTRRRSLAAGIASEPALTDEERKRLSELTKD